MSRDYKPNQEKPKSTKKGSPFFNGLLVGFLLGIAASLAVVMAIKGGDSPFADQKIDASKHELGEGRALSEDRRKSKENSQTEEQSKTSRFDFYTILPGDDNKGTSTLNNQTAATTQTTYYLQVAAYQTESEADNMKAKLALQGFETVVETVAIPNKGVLHRVRVGPLNDIEQANKTKVELANNGFNSDLIKVNNANH